MAWFDKFSNFLPAYGFHHINANSSLFIYYYSCGSLILLLNFYDILLTWAFSKFLHEFTLTLSSQFSIKVLGPLDYFLGIQITPTSNGFIVTQTKYPLNILKHAQMTGCKPTSNPMVTKTKGLTSSILFSNPAHYRSLVGTLQYLTLKWPNLFYNVNLCMLIFVSQFMHAPTEAILK